ncbi:MAG: HipA domain-containing protein [Gammaproteobacteria bacterium]|nr:HipA domain-containing protein [Gammaproteobacteria bacterium]
MWIQDRADALVHDASAVRRADCSTEKPSIIGSVESAAPGTADRELPWRFTGLVLDIPGGNTDDHASNHAAFWDGTALTLTPAYDICPQHRTGNEASQAMLITGNTRRSTLATCIEAAPNFLLNKQAAAGIIQDMLATVRTEWEATCDEANLSAVDRNLFWERIFLNPYIFEGSEGL